MKVIDKDVMYFKKVEHYDLCDGHYETTAKGLVICYLLITHKDCMLDHIELEAEHEEIGVPRAWFCRYDKERFFNTFKSLNDFLYCYDDDDFGRWRVTLKYKEVEVSVSGVRERTEIGVSYPKEEELDLEKLFGDIETLTRINGVL